MLEIRPYLMLYTCGIFTSFVSVCHTIYFNSSCTAKGKKVFEKKITISCCWWISTSFMCIHFKWFWSLMLYMYIHMLCYTQQAGMRCNCCDIERHWQRLSFQLIENKTAASVTEKTEKWMWKLDFISDWLFNDAAKICSTQMNWKRNWLRIMLEIGQYRSHELLLKLETTQLLALNWQIPWHSHSVYL